MSHSLLDAEPGAQSASLGAHELHCLRTAIRQPYGCRRFPRDMERRFQAHMRREHVVPRALLALAGAALLAGLALLTQSAPAALAGGAFAVLAWLQTRAIAHAAPEWLWLAMFALLGPGLLLLSLPQAVAGAEAQSLPREWLLCLPVAVLVLARPTVDRAAMLVLIHLLAVALVPAARGGFEAGFVPAFTSIFTAAFTWSLAAEAALLALVLAGLWRSRAVLRRCWAHSQLLQLQAGHDLLTGLPNRRALELHYRRVSREPSRAGVTVLVLVDLDHFKLANDHYGHEYGDRVLARVGGELGRVLSGSDEFAARLAGEAFALILQAENEEQIGRRVQDLLRRIEQLQIPHQRSPYGRVTASAGWARIESGARFSEPYLVADRRLRDAKFRGRNAAQGSDPIPARAPANELLMAPASS